MSCKEPFHIFGGGVVFFYILKHKSPSTVVAYENAATLFYCDAPETFCGLRSIIQHSIGVVVDNVWILIFGWTVPLGK